MAKIFLIAFVCAAAIYRATAYTGINFKDCGSKSGTVTNVEVNNCATEPCQFIRLTNATMTVTFTANADITAATNKIYGYIAGVKVPFPGPADGCQDMTCPITKGTDVTYSMVFYVRKEYPKVSLVVELQVLDQNTQDIFCIDFPAQITD